MVKPGSQRQKEYLKRLKEKKTGEYLEKERKRKKEKLMLLKATDKQHYNEKIRKDRDRKKLQRAIGRQQVWMLFFELANVKGTFCGFQQSVLRQVDTFLHFFILYILVLSSNHTVSLNHCFGKSKWELRLLKVVTTA